MIRILLVASRRWMAALSVVNRRKMTMGRERRRRVLPIHSRTKFVLSLWLNRFLRGPALASPVIYAKAGGGVAGS
jgi:hypothetical protein